MSGPEALMMSNAIENQKLKAIDSEDCTSPAAGADSSAVAGAIVKTLVEERVSKKALMDAIGKIMRTAGGQHEAIMLQVPKEVRSRLQRILPSLMIQNEHCVSHMRQLVQQPARHGLQNSARPDLQTFKGDRDRALHSFETGSTQREAGKSTGASESSNMDEELRALSDCSEAASGSDAACPSQSHWHPLQQHLDTRFDDLVNAIDQCLDAKFEERLNQGAEIQALTASLQAADIAIQKLEERLRAMPLHDDRVLATLESLERKLVSFTSSAHTVLVPADRVHDLIANFARSELTREQDCPADHNQIVVDDSGFGTVEEDVEEATPEALLPVVDDAAVAEDGVVEEIDAGGCNKTKVGQESTPGGGGTLVAEEATGVAEKVDAGGCNKAKAGQESTPGGGGTLTGRTAAGLGTADEDAEEDAPEALMTEADYTAEAEEDVVFLDQVSAPGGDVGEMDAGGCNRTKVGQESTPGGGGTLVDEEATGAAEKVDAGGCNSAKAGQESTPGGGGTFTGHTAAGLCTAVEDAEEEAPEALMPAADLTAEAEEDVVFLDQVSAPGGDEEATDKIRLHDDAAEAEEDAVFLDQVSAPGGDEEATGAAERVDAGGCNRAKVGQESTPGGGGTLTGQTAAGFGTDDEDAEEEAPEALMPEADNTAEAEEVSVFLDQVSAPGGDADTADVQEMTDAEVVLRRMPTAGRHTPTAIGKRWAMLEDSEGEEPDDGLPGSFDDGFAGHEEPEEPGVNDGPEVPPHILELMQDDGEDVLAKVLDDTSKADEDASKVWQPSLRPLPEAECTKLGVETTARSSRSGKGRSKTTAPLPLHELVRELQKGPGDEAFQDFSKLIEKAAEITQAREPRRHQAFRATRDRLRAHANAADAPTAQGFAKAVLQKLEAA